MFDIDFSKLIHSLLPSFLRKPVLHAWLMVLITPLQTLYQAFLSYRNATLASANINGQVLSLEYMLNLKYYDDGSLSHIHITDGDFIPKFYLYNKKDNKPTILWNDGEADPVYLFNGGEVSSYDFEVWVPVALEFNEDEMSALINKHKAAGFRFIIKTY